MRIHKEGYIYCIIAVIVFAFLFWFIRAILPTPIAHSILLISFLIMVWVFWFFRIPQRTFTNNENLAISPCDGKVVVIEEAEEPEYFGDKRIQVSIFMSPLDVHVNRYPISGTVDYVKYHKGKYLVALHPKSSTENERSTIVVKNDKTSVLIRQIAGAVARRIVVYAKKEDKAVQNEELGFIKFGSRVDLFFPLGTKINVKINDVVKGGISEIAQFS